MDKCFHQLGELGKVHRLDQIAIGMMRIGLGKIHFPTGSGQHHNGYGFEIGIGLDGFQNFPNVLTISRLLLVLMLVALQTHHGVG